MTPCEASWSPESFQWKFRLWLVGMLRQTDNRAAQPVEAAEVIFGVALVGKNK
jgi:hypothetical protein